MFGLIISAVSATVSAISAAVSVIGPSVANFCTNVIPTIAPIIEKGIEFLRVVGKIIETVLRIYNIFQPDDGIEDMGDRAMQGAEKGLTPDKFDNFNDYLDSIRKLVLDPEKSAQTSPEAKIVAGMAIGSQALDDKFKETEGMMNNLFALIANDPKFFSADRIASILQSTSDIASIVNYFEGRLDLTTANIIEKKLFEAERSLDPNKTNDVIYSDLDKVSAAFQNSANN